MMRPTRFEPKLVTILAVWFVPLVVACQPPAVSLEEAKKVTPSFEDKYFVPPPRTIRDITAILDQEKLADPEAAERARAAARQPPPPGLSGLALAEFFMDRAKAAGKIGGVKQNIADLKEAARLSRSAPRNFRSRVLWKLGGSEQRGGSKRDALRHREEAISLLPERRLGRSIAWPTTLARNYGSAGDLNAAERLLAMAEERLNDARLRPNAWARNGPIWTAFLNWSKAAILDLRGQHTEAERLFRLALAAAEKYNFRNELKGARRRESIRARLASNLRRQGRLVEAEIEVRKALTARLRRVGKYSPKTTSLLRKFGRPRYNTIMY